MYCAECLFVTWRAIIYPVLYVGPAAASGSLKSLQVAHNRFSAPDGLAAFARLGARNLERLHINENDFAPTAEASHQLPAHIASMAKLRRYSIAGNRWSYEDVAEGAAKAWGVEAGAYTRSFLGST